MPEGRTGSRPGRGETLVRSVTLSPPVEQPRILVIDDEPEMCLAVRHHLEDDGFLVSCARTASEARRMIRDTQPVAILIDIQLGDESGLDVLDEVRSWGDRRPAIIISVLDTMEAKLEAVRRGCDAFFAKPLDWEGLLRKLRQLLVPSSERRARRILVADGDASERAQLLTTLEEAGYEVAGCASVSSFETLLLSLQPDLVLLASRLSGTSGYDLARYLRQSDRFAATPVIFLTAGGERSSKNEAIAHGGDDCLRLPVSRALLLASVAAHIERGVKLRSLIDRELSGLLTYPGMIARASALIAEKRKHPERSFALALIKVDHFQNISDRHGHAAGSNVLATLARLLRGRFRERDVISRSHVDEFALFLNADERGLEEILLDILREFSAHTYRGEDGVPFSATFTAGVAELNPGMTAAEWKLRADRSLQEKRRNLSTSNLVMTPMSRDVFDPRVFGALIQLQERSGVPIIAEIRDLFLSALPKRIEILRRAVAAGDSKGAEQAAHAFRSAAGNLGATRLCALCAQIELTTRSKDLEHAGRLVPELIAESERVAAALRIV